MGVRSPCEECEVSREKKILKTLTRDRIDHSNTVDHGKKLSRLVVASLQFRSFCGRGLLFRQLLSTSFPLVTLNLDL